MSAPSGAPSWRWLLIFGSSFALGAGAYTLAGWTGLAIFFVAAVYSLIVQATK